MFPGIGDVVALKDILSFWGRGYYKGAWTISVISSGASELAGQGISATPIITSKGEELKPQIKAGSNIAVYLKLRDLQ